MKMFSLKEQINDSKVELSKVHFPNKNEMKKYLLNVIIVVSFMTIYLSIVDGILNNIMKYILK